MDKKYNIIYADPPWKATESGSQKTDGWDVFGNEIESDIKILK